MADKLFENAKKRLFIRYVAPKIYGDVDAVLNAVREPNHIVLINTKRLRRIDTEMLRRTLLKLQRVADASDRMIFTIEPDFYVSIPKTAKNETRELSEEEKKMKDEFEKIEMEEEMEDEKKKQTSYAQKINDFVKKKGEAKEPLVFEVKKQGANIKEAILSIKSPFAAEDIGNRMAELIELKQLVSGHVPDKTKLQISRKFEQLKESEDMLRETIMKKRRKILRKLEAINDLAESNHISKELFTRIRKHLTEELEQLGDMIVTVDSKGVKFSAKKTDIKAKTDKKKKVKR
ncbi:MAG: hypothetical protein V1836_02680 [Candidatus Aenigmatarchaeota archaeon]